MLTREENWWNFKFISICSSLNILPLKINMATGKVQRQPSKNRTWACATIFCCGSAHCSFMLWRLAQSTILEPDKYFQWDHFIIHFPYSIGSSLLYYTAFRLFRKNPEECVMIFNQLFVERQNPVEKMVGEKEPGFHRQSRGKHRKRGQKLAISSCPENQIQDLDSGFREKSGSGSVRPLLAWPPQYSLDEILARTLSLIIMASTFFVVIILAIDPSRPQHLYSILPPEYQNVWSFLILLAIEAFFVTVACIVAAFSSVCQLLFFGKCQAEVKRLDIQLRQLQKKFQSRPDKNREMRREIRIWILRQISKEMREFVLFVELFNRVFPPCIFAFKLVCFFSIPFYFFAIRHGQDFPFLGLFTGYSAVALSLFYGIIYQKAFWIPQKMERLKREFLLTSHNTTSKSKSTPEHSNLQERCRAEMTLEMWGIRDVGVKVGNFHTLERESTPRFIDFALKNVVNLLVTFPR